MGIRGLGGFIKWRLPQIRKTLSWVKYSGERWGVDCSCLLYRAKGVSLSPATVIACMIVKMRRFGIEPVFIFDGRPPMAKADVVDQRRVIRQAVQKEMAEIKMNLESDELTGLEKFEMERRHASLQKKAPSVSGGEKDDIKKLLYACGVQFITAAGEADDVLGYLCRNGTLQGVVSTDMDMLARGVPVLVIPETADATVLTTIQLQDVLVGLGLGYTQFVDACMLMGSDYSCKGWQSMDPKDAVASAKKGVHWASVDPTGVMEQGVALLTGAEARWEELVGDKQRAKWDLGAPSCEPDNIAAAAKIHGWPMDWIGVLSHRE